MEGRRDLRQTTELSTPPAQAPPPGRHARRLLSALVLVLLLAAALGACGGDSDSDSASETTAPSPATVENGSESRSREQSQDQGGSPDQGGQQGQDRSQSAGNDSPPKNVVTPLEVSGGGSEQFRVKGGDNSVQEYGEEADGSELQEVAELVHDFYVARASGAWSEACSYLSAGLRERFEELGAKSGTKECVPFLKAFTSDLPAAVWREITDVDAASLRHDGQQAFLIYRGAKDVVYAMPLYEEGGEWKITALSAAALG